MITTYRKIILYNNSYYYLFLILTTEYVVRKVTNAAPQTRRIQFSVSDQKKTLASALNVFNVSTIM